MPPYRPLQIELAQLFNPIMFAIFVVISNTAFFAAIRKGPASLTNTIVGFSMLIPIIFGHFFWYEHITILQVCGIILILIALFFFNKKANENEMPMQTKKASLGWLLTSVLASFTVGCAIIFTRQNSLQFPNHFKEYLIILNFASIIITAPYVVWAVKKKKITLKFDPRFLILMALMGIVQSMYNVFYTIYIGQFDVAYFLPILVVSSMLLVVGFGRIYFKEKLSKFAYIGIIIGLFAIVFLSI